MTDTNEWRLDIVYEERAEGGFTIRISALDLPAGFAFSPPEHDQLRTICAACFDVPLKEVYPSYAPDGSVCFRIVAPCLSWERKAFAQLLRRDVKFVRLGVMPSRSFEIRGLPFPHRVVTEAEMCELSMGH